MRRRSEEASLEPKGDVRYRSMQPQPGKMLTQHTGLPPRAGVTGKKPGFKTARPGAATGAKSGGAGGGRKPR